MLTEHLRSALARRGTRGPVRYVQYIERQVVLVDALEDAYDRLNDLEVRSRSPASCPDCP